MMKYEEEKVNSTSDQIISKVALTELIRETEMLLEDMYQNSDKFQPWHRRVVGDNLRTLRMISRRLGYKDEG
jgi:hypothetical protein